MRVLTGAVGEVLMEPAVDHLAVQGQSEVDTPGAGSEKLNVLAAITKCANGEKLQQHIYRVLFTEEVPVGRALLLAEPFQRSLID
jgi:hypothetical protein